MGCKNSCRILFPIYNCRGKRILFLRRTNRMTFFIIRQEKYFFQKVDNVRVVSRSNTKKGSLKFGTVKRAVAKGEENEAYRQNGIL